MTARNGFGSTDHKLLTQTGIQENLTTPEDMRGVERCILLHVEGHGTIRPAVTLCFTFVKPKVRGLYMKITSWKMRSKDFYSRVE